MKIIITLIWVFLIPFCARGQLNNEVFEQHKKIVEADSNILYLGINTLGFVKNNEYFNDIADGYTLFGYQVNPFFSYQPGGNFRVQAGVYLQKDLGSSGYRKITPTFSFKYMKDDFKLVFGTLEGSLAHRLIEPLYDFENVLNRRLENGFQLVWDKEFLFADVWVDWQNMIYKGDTEQERILGGLSFNYALMTSKKIKWRIPLQILLNHRGGQIDDNPEPLETRGNAAIGMELEFPFFADGLINNIRTNNYYVHSRNFSSTQAGVLGDDGKACYFNISMEMKYNLEVMASYWNSNEFVSIMGGQLYPSVSSTFKKPDFIEKSRELLIFRFMHNLKIMDDLYFSTRVEPYVDLKNGNFEFSYGFYINYRTNFFITRAHNNR